MRRHRSHTALGVVTLLAAGVLSPSLVIWMSPTIAGLILSIPLSWASGQLWIGVGLRRLGLLTTPEETAYAADHRARQRAGRRSSPSPATTTTTACARSSAIPLFARAHEMFLPDAGRHRRGEIDVDEAVATAKLNDARSLEEACAWLKPKERLAVLNDRALIALLARLPATHRAARRGGSRRGGGDSSAGDQRPLIAPRATIEQRKRQQPRDEAADMGDPGDRRVRSAERLRAGAEHEVGRHPDRDEDERRGAVAEQLRAEFGAGRAASASISRRREALRAAERRARLEDEPRRRGHQPGIGGRGADQRGEIHRVEGPVRERAGDRGQREKREKAAPRRNGARPAARRRPARSN